MLLKYQLMIADLYHASIGNIKKILPNVFDKEKYAFDYQNLQFFLR